MTVIESRLAKKYDLKCQIKSGALPGSKEDMYDDLFLYQSKYSSGKQINVKLKDLEQLEEHALEYGKRPMMIISFRKKDYFVIDVNDYATMYDLFIKNKAKI